MESTPSSRNFTTEFSEAPPQNTSVYNDCIYSADFYFGACDSIAAFFVNAALNFLLYVVTIIANILVFAAIRKSTSLHLPSKLLLCGLVLTDLAVGLIAQPLFAAFLVSKVKDVSGSGGILCFLVSLGIIGATMSYGSLCTMTLISVDRYIAFHFHLRYKEIVTAKRVVVSLVAVWLNPVFLAATTISYNFLVLSGASFFSVRHFLGLYQDLLWFTSSSYLAIRYKTKHKSKLDKRQETH